MSKEKSKTNPWVILLVIAGVIIIGKAGQGEVSKSSGKPHPTVTVTAGTKVSPARAISFAQKQLGKPYEWGAYGPSSFDCSGLVYKAYGLPWSQRTSQEQWDTLPKVDKPKPGDLVYFHGVLEPGEKPPGHVGIVVSDHEMIDAYGTGTPIQYHKFGTSAALASLQDVWGYTAP